MEWFRLYDEIIDDPKVIALTASLWRNYVELMCVANRQPVRGTLPTVEHVAIHLRVKPSVAAKALDALKAAGLIDEDAATKRLAIHGWETRQRQSDDAAARMANRRAERKSNRPADDVPNMFRTCSAPRVRATDTETDTETESPLTPRGGGVVGGASEGAHPASPPASLPASPAALAPGVAAPGSPSWSAVVGSVPPAWGPQGEAACVRMLSAFPPDVVAFGLEKLLDKFEGAFPAGASGWWRTVCHNNPEGRPRARAAKAAPPTLKFSVPNPEEIYHPAKLAKMREAGRA